MQLISCLTAKNCCDNPNLLLGFPTVTIAEWRKLLLHLRLHKHVPPFFSRTCAACNASFRRNHLRSIRPIIAEKSLTRKIWQMEVVLSNGTISSARRRHSTTIVTAEKISKTMRVGELLKLTAWQSHEGYRWVIGYMFLSATPSSGQTAKLETQVHFLTAIASETVQTVQILVRTYLLIYYAGSIAWSSTWYFGIRDADAIVDKFQFKLNSNAIHNRHIRDIRLPLGYRWRPGLTLDSKWLN